MSLPVAKYYVWTPTPITISIPTVVYTFTNHGFILRLQFNPTPWDLFQPFLSMSAISSSQTVKAPNSHQPQYILIYLLTNSHLFCSFLFSKTDLPSSTASSFTSPHHQPQPESQDTLSADCRHVKPDWGGSRHLVGSNSYSFLLN